MKLIIIAVLVLLVGTAFAMAQATEPKPAAFQVAQNDGNIFK